MAHSFRRFAHIATAASALAFGASGVSAAGAASAGDGADEDMIIVTAQKREERLQDVPLSVSAISSESLLDRNQTRIQDYFANVPGLNISAQGNGQTNLAIRGITTGQTTNPAVGIVIDDVPFGGSNALAYASRLMPDLDPGSLARIEVLRGPQGTLYGASSIGGLLKFVTREPSMTETSWRGEVGASDVSGGAMGFSARGAANIPLTDKLALRASGFFRRDGGYVDNVLTGRSNVNRIESYGGHVAALWRPAEPLSVKLSALLQNVTSNGSSEVDTDASLRPVLGSLRQARLPGVDHYDIKSRLFYATIGYDLGSVDLTSVTGYGISDYSASIESTYRFGDLANRFFGVPGAALANDFRTKKFSQEVRLASSGENILDWVVGAFYTHETTSALQRIQALDAIGAVANSLQRTEFPTKFRELAGFASVTLHLGERFDIQAGGRYSGNKQDYEEEGVGRLGGNYRRAQTSRDHKFTYHVTPRFRISEDAMVYARVATGYRVGGPNPLTTADAAAAGVPTEYGPDTTTNYEIGLKGNAADGALTFDLSAYHIDWKNIQLALTSPTTGYYYFTNGPSAKSEGVEASLTVAPGGGLKIGFNASYNKAELKADMPAGSARAIAGDRLPFSSKFTASTSIDQDFGITDRWDGFWGAGLTYVGKRPGEFVSRPTSPRIVYPDYVSVDLRAGLRMEPWTLSFYVTNLTDARGVVGVSTNSRAPTATSFYGVNYIRPRTVGMTLATAF